MCDFVNYPGSKLLNVLWDTFSHATFVLLFHGNTLNSSYFSSIIVHQVLLPLTFQRFSHRNLVYYIKFTQIAALSIASLEIKYS